MSLDSDTTLSAVGDGRFETEIVDGWDIRGNANGGYLLALIARAMLADCARRDPVTISAHYLSPGRPGPALVQSQVVRSGRRFATVSATLESDGRPVIQALGSFGDLAPISEPVHIDSAPPELPAPETCGRYAEVRPDGQANAFMQRVDLRLHPDDAGFARGEPSGEAKIRGWFRLPDGEPLSSLSLLLAVDSFPPAFFNVKPPQGWIPTIELTAHLRGRPAPGWLRCAFSTRFVTGGFFEEDSEIWDSSGRLVAQSRQLALAPRDQPDTP